VNDGDAEFSCEELCFNYWQRQIRHIQSMNVKDEQTKELLVSAISVLNRLLILHRPDLGKSFPKSALSPEDMGDNR